MDEIKDILQSQLAGTIDFEGQAKADKFLNVVINAGVALSIVAGIVTQNFESTFIGLGATYVASLIFCLPIPAYRRHPVKFVDPSQGAKFDTSSMVVEVTE